MNDLLWYLFEKSGSIDCYLAYKHSCPTGEATNELRENTRTDNT